MEIYLIAQSGVIALIQHITIYTHAMNIIKYTSHTTQPICRFCILYARQPVSALKTKLNQKHCLKFMWSIYYGLAIVNVER